MASSELVDRLVEVEKAAEEVLADKHEIVALDRRRNLNREAARAVDAAARADWRGDGGQTWMALGGANSFVLLPNRKVKDIIKKDQAKLDGQISELRGGLKAKVNTLREKEGSEELRGFGLAALSKEELAAVKGVIGPAGTS